MQRDMLPWVLLGELGFDCRAVYRHEKNTIRFDRLTDILELLFLHACMHLWKGPGLRSSCHFAGWLWQSSCSRRWHSSPWSLTACCPCAASTIPALASGLQTTKREDQTAQLKREFASLGAPRGLSPTKAERERERSAQQGLGGEARGQVRPAPIAQPKERKRERERERFLAGSSGLSLLYIKGRPLIHVPRECVRTETRAAWGWAPGEQ